MSDFKQALDTMLEGVELTMDQVVRDHGTPEAAHWSGGQEAMARIALSLFNGSADVNLSRDLAKLDLYNYQRVVTALQTVR